MTVFRKDSAAVRRSGSRNVLLLALLCGLGWHSTSAQVQKSSDPVVTEAEQAMFAKGQHLYNEGLYGESIAVFKELLARYPGSTIADLTLLWLGRSHLGQGDIVSAEKIVAALKAIPETSLLDLYEDELRIARQNYANAAAPKRSGTVKPVKTEAPINSEDPGRSEPRQMTEDAATAVKAPAKR